MLRTKGRKTVKGSLKEKSDTWRARVILTIGYFQHFGTVESKPNDVCWNGDTYVHSSTLL